MRTSRPLALVTGASSGIGAVFARKLAIRGYDLALVARREERLRQLSAELRDRHGAAAEVISADLASDADLRRVEQRIVALEPDLLVNNAGFGTRGLFFETDLERQEEMHRVHVIAILRLTHAALRGMVARERGAVINVSSVAAFLQGPGNISYCATKAWINSFTEGLRLELKNRGSPVRVQALCPGFTFSEFHDVVGVDRKQIPARMWMSAEAVVEESLAALEKDRLIVVPGWMYRLFLAVQRRAPQRMREALALRSAKRWRPDSTPGAFPPSSV
jgi:hypothetical protein